MPAIIQYEFNNEKQWKTAGEPRIIDTAAHIAELDFNPITGRYHVEVIFIDTDDVPENGLLSAKTSNPIPHEFIGFETLEEYQKRKVQ
tara:strand:- start:265 stop:528 length:264 start_codon:yes stop_codon:yes gene_type:complete